MHNEFDNLFKKDIDIEDEENDLMDELVGELGVSLIIEIIKGFLDEFVGLLEYINEKDELFDNMAEISWKYFVSLVEVGFSEDQAMEIMLSTQKQLSSINLDKK